MSQVNEAQNPSGAQPESPRPAQSKGLAMYVASRASVPERGAMWRKFRDEGFRITSSWIDEDGEGETQDFGELWERIADEILCSDGLVLYAEPDDFPLKGAFIEAGIALGMNKRVIVCLPNVTVESRSCRPIGSWINHPLVERENNVRMALGMIAEGVTHEDIYETRQNGAGLGD